MRFEYIYLYFYIYKLIVFILCQFSFIMYFTLLSMIDFYNKLIFSSIIKNYLITLKTLSVSGK